MTLLCSAKIDIVIGNAKVYFIKMSLVTLLCNVYNGVLLEDHKKLIFKCPFFLSHIKANMDFDRIDSSFSCHIYLRASYKSRK